MSRRYRLLYAEDNPQDADLTAVALRQHAPEFDLVTVDTGAACLARLEQETFDLLLLDHRLQDMEGLEVLEALGRRDVALPAIMVTGVGNEALVVQALRLGAVDYLPKRQGYLEQLPGVLRRALQERAAHQELAPTVLLGKRHVLYAEHNAMDLELTLSYFATLAPEVVWEVVRSGPEALERLARPHQFDLLLADLRLPGMDGLELLHEIRRRGYDLPVVVITGRGNENAAVAALRLGAYDYIIKREDYLHQLPYSLDNAIIRYRLGRRASSLQAELQALNRSLEQKVQDRTAELERQAAELQAAEQAARRSEERFRRLAEQSPDVLYTLNLATHRIAFLNRTSFLGYSLDEVQQPGSLLGWVHPEDLPGVQEQWQRALAGEEAGLEAAEYRVRRKDGAEEWLASRITTLSRGEDGKPLELLVTLTTITPHKQAELVLQQYARRLGILHDVDEAIRTTQSLEPIAAAALSQLSQWLGCSAAWLTVLDRERDELVLMGADESEGTRRVSGIDQHLPAAWFDLLSAGQLLRLEEEAGGGGPGPAPLWGRGGCRVQLHVGLLDQEQLLGLLTLNAASTDAFGPEDTAIAQEVGNQLAIALRQNQLQAAEREKHALNQVLQEVGAAMVASLELDAIFSQLFHHIARVINYDMGNVMAIEGGRVRLSHARGYEEQLGAEAAAWVRSQEFALDEMPNLRRLVQTRAPLIIPDTQQDPEWLVFEPTRQVRSWAAVPLVVEGQVVAALALDGLQPGAFQQKHAGILAGFAGQAALALQIARLFQQLRASEKELRSLASYLQRAREEERGHISREIHDALGQSLTALKIDMSWLARRLPDQPEALRHRAQDLLSLIDQTIQQVRQIAAELRPGMLDDLGLLAALEWQAREFEGRSEVACVLDLPEAELEVPPDLATALFRIFQESLTNVARHAGASLVRARLFSDGQNLTLEVGDDGRGITAEERNSPRSLGLIGMRERARSLGGWLEIAGMSGQGTRLTVSLPLPPQEGLEGHD